MPNSKLKIYTNGNSRTNLGSKSKPRLVYFLPRTTEAYDMLDMFCKISEAYLFSELIIHQNAFIIEMKDDAYCGIYSLSIKFYQECHLRYKSKNPCRTHIEILRLYLVAMYSGIFTNEAVNSHVAWSTVAYISVHPVPTSSPMKTRIRCTLVDI